MTDPQFDPLIHEPTRLQICGILAAVSEAEFATIRDTLEIADSVTSKHLKALQAAGYVWLEKRSVIGRPRTWASLSQRGREAFEAHVAELRRLASLVPDA